MLLFIEPEHAGTVSGVARGGRARLQGTRVLLDVEVPCQERSHWCWAALAEGLATYYRGQSPSQEVIARQLFACGDHVELSDRDARLDEVLTRFGCYSHWSPGKPTLERIRCELASGRPLACRIEWSGGGQGHYVLISGFDTSAPFIRIADPRHGTCWSSLDAFPSLYREGGAWTETFWTRPPPSQPQRESMSPTPNYDVIVGASQASLNQTAANLFAVPAAKTNIFSGQITQSVPPLGSVALSFQVKAAPTLALTAPTAAQWQDAVKISPTTPMPTSNAFQLMFSDIAGSVTIGSSSPLPAEGALTIFGQLQVAGGQASLLPLAVYIDESSFSAWDKIIVNQLLIPQALKMATSVLSGLGIPSIPTFLGLTFQAPIAVISSGYLLAATTLTSSAAPVLDGVTPPTLDLFAGCTLTPVNQVLANEINGQSFSKEDKTGPSGWYAAGRVKADNVQSSASIVNDGLQLSLSASVSGYGELGGVGVGITKAVLCPIGAAVDAIADPGNWDKVISSFDIQYSPDPLAVPLTLAAGTASTSGQPVLLSVGDLGSTRLIYKPTWSGSVSGTVLSAAAAAFIDLVSVIFGKLILEKIVKDDGQSRTVYTLPPLAQTLEGVTATLTIGTSQPVTVWAGNTFVQSLQVSFS